jgi:hypothetical protein
MTTRAYTDKTLKILFGSSGGQCAYPGCTSSLIAAGTPDSDAAVLGYICHIYAAADDGPRGKPELTEAERNAPENLILMCGHHHPLVDKQWETYPAELLLAWKTRHEAKFHQGTAEALKLQESMQQLSFLRAYSDKEIQAELNRIRQGRSLHGFPTEEVALQFAERVERTELAGGSKELRAQALAWCARLLARDTRERAQALLEQSRLLAPTHEADIAEAAITATTDRDGALAKLARIDTLGARTAALRTMSNSEGTEASLRWATAAGLTLASFDADGKLVLIQNEVMAGKWAEAADNTAMLTDADFIEAPVLHSAAAMSYLMQGVPEELRASARAQVPFHSTQFRLSSDQESLAARRQAAFHFERLAEFARSISVAEPANLASEYALWLRLRDPRDHATAMEELCALMRDPDQSLRRLNLAIQFGLKLDIAAIEREIDRRVALSGSGTMEEAYARLALAFTQRDEKGVADYIARHRRQLHAHLEKNAILAIETEMLARSGQAGAAKERLAEAVANGLDSQEQQRLDRLIAEAEGADPALERKKLYETTGSLADLGNLIQFLGQSESWQELCPYAEKMFERTHAVEDAQRFAEALSETRQYDRLQQFLTEWPALVGQSALLKTMLSWSCYREGEFEQARLLLDELSAGRDDPNDRSLRANLAIASGRWDDLVTHCASEWIRRGERTAIELLQAGQLAHAAHAPHAADFIRAAVAQAPDNPNVLLAAYTQATSAGWERDADAGNWLMRAAELSDDHGPIQSMSMREVIDQKPDWDKRETTVLQQLNEGMIPTFAAAHMLNRSFIDFALLQSLANLSEGDARRRSIVYAYSGARPARCAVPGKTLALDLAAIFTLARLDLLSTVLNTYDRLVIPNSTLGWLFEERLKASFHQPSQIRDAHYRRRLVADGDLKVLPEQPIQDIALAKEVGIGLSALLLTAELKASLQDGIARHVVRSAPVHRLGSLMEEEADLSRFAGRLRSCQAVVDKLRASGAITLPEERRAAAYLKLHERRWPDEPAIPDGAELYLDDLSVSYFQTVGILRKLKGAGLTAYITEAEDKDANRLIAFESLSAEQLDIIESIRKTLADGLESGKVKAVKSRAPDDGEPIRSHPTFGVLGIEAPVDACVVDDRFVNRHAFMDLGNRRTPILTTIDLLDDLAERGAIAGEDVFAHRTYLRRAGFAFVPLTEAELVFHLGNAALNQNRVVETAELRAIRESLLRARMSKTLQLPSEGPWLLQSMRAMAGAIRTLWTERTNLEEAASYSDWLLDLFDIRGWTPSAAQGAERQFALYAHAAHIQSLFSPPGHAADDVKESYHAWIDERVLQGMKETEPEAFAWLADRARESIAEAAEEAAGGREE